MAALYGVHFFIKQNYFMIVLSSQFSAQKSAVHTHILGVCGRERYFGSFVNTNKHCELKILNLPFKVNEEHRRQNELKGDTWESGPPSTSPVNLSAPPPVRIAEARMAQWAHNSGMYEQLIICPSRPNDIKCFQIGQINLRQKNYQFL